MTVNSILSNESGGDDDAAAQAAQATEAAEARSMSDTFAPELIARAKMKDRRHK